MKIAEKEYKSKKKIISSTPKNKKILEETPEWFNKNIEANEVSEEEEKAFIEKLKNIK